MALVFALVVVAAFGGVYAADLVQLTCLSEMAQHTSCAPPWVTGGMSRFSCAYELIGVVVFAFLLLDLLHCLGNCEDDPGGTLQKAKTRELNELQRQTEGVLSHCQQQANDLC